MRRFNIGVWLVVGLCLFALLPLALSDGVVLGHDSLLHAHRMAEIQRLWSQGVAVPQWADTFYFGYGSPVFIYYASLVHYGGAVLMMLGLTVVQAIKVIIALCLLFAGIGMYRFMCPYAGQAGGLLSAVCYVYSPYLLFTEPHTRGNYPELLAFALFPIALCSADRLLTQVTPRRVVVTGITVGLLLLSHNLMGLVLTGVIGAWVVWQIIGQRPKRYTTFITCLTIFLGILLASYLLVPVFAERDLIRVADVDAFTRSRLRDFFGMFVSLDRLLEFPSRIDWGAVNGMPMHYELGVAQWVLALVGMVAVWVQRRHRSTAVFFGLLALVCVIMTLPQAYPIWEHLPALSFLTFPWRLLGVATFGVSVLAGMSVHWLSEKRYLTQQVLLGIGLLAPLVCAVPMLFIPTRYTSPIQTSVKDYVTGETNGQIAPGTTSYNEFLPKTVDNLPSGNADLLNDVVNGYPIDALNHRTLPPDTHAELLDSAPESSTWSISTATATPIEILKFYFRGWQAEIDGQHVELLPNSTGFMTLTVPSGEHTVHIGLASTPSRTLGRMLSIGALVGLMGLWGVVYRPSIGVSVTPDATQDVQWGAIGAGLAYGVLLILGGREGIAWLNSPLDRALPAQHAVFYELKQAGQLELRLLGYDVSSTTTSPNGQIQVTLYWSAPAPLSYRYSAFVHVSKPSTPPVAQFDQARVGEREPNAWSNNGYVIDRYTITLPENTPLGEYNLSVGVYTCETLPANACGNGERLSVYDHDTPLGDAIPLGQLLVQ